MRLAYIYIHKFRNLQEVGFNLCSDYNIEFTKELVGKEYINIGLSIEKTNHGLPHLFDKNIVDIKGIVGENGAGKSTLLEFLTEECHHRTVSFGEKVPSRNLLVYEDDNRMLKIVCGSSWELTQEQISIGKNVPFIFDEGSFKSVENEISWEDINGFRNTNMVYYSNVFDNKISEEFNGLINVSTNFLAQKDVERRTNNEAREGELFSHRMEELRRQLNFAIRFKDELPFKLPEYGLITVQNRSYQALNDNKSKYDDQVEMDENSYFNKISLWLKILDQKQKNQSLGEKRLFLSYLEQTFFSYFIYNELLPRNGRLMSNFDAIAKSIFDELLRQIQSDNGSVDLNRLIEFTEAEEGKADFDGRIVSFGKTAWTYKLKMYKKFVDLLSPFLSEDTLLYGASARIAFSPDFTEVIKAYDETVQITGYLDIVLSGLSTGEMGFLTLFSRFYSLTDPKRYPNEEIAKRNNLMLFIDEGDLYFHPKWQGKFIYFLNKILPMVFEEKKIQIFVTSHSQFIASDLPSSHLLFLKKDDDDNCKVVEGLNKTFAANIHDLLASTFFLEGAHIGEFAKSTIYKVIDQVASKNSVESFSDSELKAIIHSIGEPWVRDQLIEKYEEYLLKK